MSFSLVNPSGWTTGDLLTETQINQLDQDHAAAVDSAGGSYSPAAVITLAAKGLAVTGIFDAPGIGLYNVKRYNATGDGSADDTAEIQAGEDAVAATTGGKLFFPPGTYKITADIVKSQKVDWVGVPGTVTIMMDHATDNVFTFTGSAWTREATIHGINFEAAQSNTGIFCNEVGTLFKLRFEHCKLNNSAALIAGKLFSAVSASELTLEDCDFRAVKVNDSHFAMTKLTLIRGKLTMAPAATSDLISVAGTLKVDGTEFVHVSTVGNVAFIDTNGGNVHVNKATFDVDDSGAGASTCALKINGGTVYTDGCNFDSDVIPYEYAVLAAAGSRLQLLPARRIDGLTGDVTLTLGYEAFIVETSKATAPNVTPASVLYPGQPLKIILRNVSGGTWGGQPTYVGMYDQSSGLSGLLDTLGQATSWVALDMVDDGTAVWVQSAAAATITI